jgi:Glycosyltransferase family 92
MGESPRFQYYLVVASMFKDEGPYLAEWVSHHLAQGADHIVLYDNGSSDNGASEVKRWIDSGHVTLINWPEPKSEGSQYRAVHHSLELMRERARWITFLDTDEFLFSPGGASLPTVLRAFEDEVGIDVHWICYGSSGHLKKPVGSVRESYLYRAPIQFMRNRQFKTIVDPREAINRKPRQHDWQFRNGRRSVNEARMPLAYRGSLRDRWEQHLHRRLPSLHRWLAERFPLHFSYYFVIMRPVSADILRINHYVVRSRQEFAEKQSRHGAHRADKYSESFFNYHDRNEVLDPILSPRQNQELRR